MIRHDDLFSIDGLARKIAAHHGPGPLPAPVPQPNGHSGPWYLREWIMSRLGRESGDQLWYAAMDRVADWCSITGVTDALRNADEKMPDAPIPEPDEYTACARWDLNSWLVWHLGYEDASEVWRHAYAQLDWEAAEAAAGAEVASGPTFVVARTTAVNGCLTCAAFEPSDLYGGHCRRHAATNAGLFRWPETGSGDWCCEWLPIPTVKEPGDLPGRLALLVPAPDPGPDPEPDSEPTFDIDDDLAEPETVEPATDEPSDAG